MSGGFFQLPPLAGGTRFRLAGATVIAAACVVCGAQMYTFLSSILVQYATKNAHSLREMQVAVEVGNAACRTLYVAFAVLRAGRNAAYHAAVLFACHVLISVWTSPMWVASAVWGMMAACEVVRGAACVTWRVNSGGHLPRVLILYGVLCGVLCVVGALLAGRVLGVVLCAMPATAVSHACASVFHVCMLVCALGDFVLV